MFTKIKISLSKINYKLFSALLVLGLGKTNYMLLESVVTNTIYYGIAFILYATNVWTPTLTGIALLFGIGNAFDSIVSLVAYAFMLKKEKINILRVE